MKNGFMANIVHYVIGFIMAFSRTIKKKRYKSHFCKIQWTFEENRGQEEIKISCGYFSIVSHGVVVTRIFLQINWFVDVEM